MSYELSKFRVVIIDFPLLVLNEAICSEVLGKTLKMKFDGYIEAYGGTVMPTDKADFFGTHIILCEEIKDELVPVFAYKSSPLDRCLKYGFEFPGITLMKSDGHPSCVSEMERIIENVGDPSSISFDSSWAQDINYRFSKDAELKKFFREIMMMLIVRHHEEFNIPHMFTLGVVKVKTDQFFFKVGLNKLNENANFHIHNSTNDEAVLFYNNRFSEEAYLMSKKYDDLWKNKLLISGLRKESIIRKAA